MTTVKAANARSVFAIRHKAEPLVRIQLIREGVSPEDLIMTAGEMGITNEKVFSLLNFPRATFNRRRKYNQVLPVEQSERIVGLQSLIGQVESMVAESGDPGGFNAAQWVAKWLEQPLPALDNAKPAAFMDTMAGIELVSSLLAQTQSGAYA